MTGNKYILNGTITRGLGEGTFFMSMQHYKKEIKKKLGFEAYPGTLNLKVIKKHMDLLKNIVPIEISGFKLRNKTFGGADCYRAKVNYVNGAIIIPHINKHKGKVIEFIAPVHLKSELKLKDKNKVKIELI